MIGRVLGGRYRIESTLGRGGVGIVYRAEHTLLHRPVAVKVLDRQFVSVQELRRRFEREAKALSTLSHPNIVSISDYGIDEYGAYLAMELLEGQTLADFLDEGPPSANITLELMRDILRGLAFAHARGVVHRDLKPANVFLQELPDQPRHVKLLDFGLAKVAATDTGDGRGPEPTLTRLGTILGTPAYMSPEQAAGERVDARSDVYSAGVVLFEMLTGRYPFDAPTRTELLRAHMIEPVPPPADIRPGLWVSPSLEALIVKAMAKDRSARFSDAGIMLAAIDQLPRPAARYEQPTPSAVFDAANARSVGTEDPTVPVSSEERPPTPVVASPPSLVAKTAPQPRARGNRIWIWVAAVGALLVAAAAYGAMAYLPGGDDGGTPAPDAAGGSAAPGAPGRGAGPSLAGPAPVVSGRPDRGAQATGGSATGVVPAAIDPETAVGEPATPGDEGPPVVQPPRDPFRASLSRELRRYHARVRTGRELSRGDINQLYALQRRDPADARPTLILAHTFVDREWFSDALTRYERAIEIDSSVRGDGRMLSDLLNMMTSERVADRAAEVVVRVYGSEAVDKVERALGRPDLSPEYRARLVALRTQLGPGAP